MKLIFTGHNDRYAIEQDLLAFFPTERPVYDGTADETRCAWVKLSEGKMYTTATTRIVYDGPYPDEFSLKIAAEAGIELHKMEHGEKNGKE